MVGRPLGRCASRRRALRLGGSTISKLFVLHCVIGRRTGVVYEVALGHFELAVVGFDFEHVGFDEDALNLGGDVVDRDVARRAALGRGNKVAGALVGYANQIGAAAGLVERVVSVGVGGGVGHFAHAGLHVDQHYGVARGGLAGGLVGHRAGDGGGLRQSGGEQQAQSKSAKSEVASISWSMMDVLS